MLADVGQQFAHYSDPRVLSRESDENKLVLYEQAARLRWRSEAAIARAVFLAVRAANGVSSVTKKPVTEEEFFATYPELER